MGQEQKIMSCESGKLKMKKIYMPKKTSKTGAGGDKETSQGCVWKYYSQKNQGTFLEKMCIDILKWKREKLTTHVQWL